MDDRIKLLEEQLDQCDREIFALQERKRDLRRSIRIIKEAEKFESKIAKRAEREKKSEEIKKLLS